MRSQSKNKYDKVLVRLYKYYSLFNGGFIMNTFNKLLVLALLANANSLQARDNVLSKEVTFRGNIYQYTFDSNDSHLKNNPKYPTREILDLELSKLHCPKLYGRTKKLKHLRKAWPRRRQARVNRNNSTHTQAPISTLSVIQLPFRSTIQTQPTIEEKKEVVIAALANTLNNTIEPEMPALERAPEYRYRPLAGSVKHFPAPPLPAPPQYSYRKPITSVNIDDEDSSNGQEDKMQIISAKIIIKQENGNAHQTTHFEQQSPLAQNQVGAIAPQVKNATVPTSYLLRARQQCTSIFGRFFSWFTPTR
jgi:hypothetical protein